MAAAQPNPPPPIPDHELLRCVGKGSYGEVWLARSVMGTPRAVKVIRRETFDHNRPFEREFSGIEKFEPVSRTHPGLVSVLHIGRNGPGGYFYYIMEVADDVMSGQDIDPARYKPRTLAGDLRQRGRLPVEECVQIACALANALGHLHAHGLIHRDIKPSNIIFVDGRPKFADIGLVTDTGDVATCVGTPGFIPPEGPGSPVADLFSFGKLIYQMGTGKAADAFPEMPNPIDPNSVELLHRLQAVVLKACADRACDRHQSAGELHTALASVITAPSPAQSPVRPAAEEATQIATSPGLRGAAAGDRAHGRHLALLYKSGAGPDAHLVEVLAARLARAGFDVFMDKHLTIGVEWARAIETRIRQSDAVIILLSAASVQSEMLACEVEIAHQSAQQDGKPLLLPVRVAYTGPLSGTLGPALERLHYFLWEGAPDDERLVGELLRALDTSQKSLPTAARPKLESVGGAVPLQSRFYVVRPTDQEFQAAIARRDSIVLVKGARQMGKTSLLARGLQEARQSGARVVLTDFQKLNAAHLSSVESFFKTLGDFVADQLDLNVLPEDVWDQRRSPNTNFERFLRREVLNRIEGHLVWGMDEVDRLFACEFGSEVFGLFRSWHNERALDPTGPWARLTLAMAYATEAHLFITDVNQSPFNVGTRLQLDDFTPSQVAELNQRYGQVLRPPVDIGQFHQLLGGHPYLVRRGLNELAAGRVTAAGFATQADLDEGIFGDHLRRLLVLLARDPELTEVVRGVLRGEPCPDTASFYRLRSAGVMRGDTPRELRPRCGIYGSYLRRHLL